jgi:hypothetical protein
MPGPPVQERIETLENRALAVELMIEAERLNATDDLWTRYLAENDEAAEILSNLPVLESLVGEMVGMLSSVSAKARELSLLVQEYPSDLDTELEQLFEQHPAREQLIAGRPDGPFAQAVIEACAVIEKESPHEMALLTRKLERIAEGKFESGDLRRFFKCALLVVAAGAGVMSVVASGGLVVLPAAVLAGSGAAGLAASTLIGWNGWDCKKGGPGPEPATA